jgi:hypothetical protein
MRAHTLILASSLAWACPPATETDAPEQVADGDGDGWTEVEDCDDQDPAVHPGAEERCDGVDQDCDGAVDEDAVDALAWYADGDGDGWGDDASEAWACAAPEGAVERGGDCDDDADSVHPGADEHCDGEDEDCDGDIDEDAVDATLWYPDSDGDGWGDDDQATAACEATSGAVSTAGDCDDDAVEVHPGASEHCGDGVDQDCDGEDEVCLGERWSSDHVLSDVASLMITGFGYFGSQVAIGDDLDGDGSADLVVGNPGYYDKEHGWRVGAVHVFSTPITAATADEEHATLSLFGEEESDDLCERLAYVGDVTGDAHGDFAVGSIDWASSQGAVYLISSNAVGAAGETAVITERADAWVYGERRGSWAGQSMSGGDVDGDGISDLLVGAHQMYLGGNDEGRVYLLAGPVTARGETISDVAAATYSGANVDDMAGLAVACDGDLDGDGLANIVVSAPLEDSAGPNRGAVYVVDLVSGDLVLEAHSSVATITGENDYDDLGYSLTMDADLDGDGTDDLVIGACYNDDGGATSGKIYVFLGPVEGELPASAADIQVPGPLLGGGLGMSVDGVPDLDGDGADELLAGGLLFDDYRGSAHLIYGGSLGVIDLHAEGANFIGSQPYENAGLGIAGASDLDGDGGLDLAIGAGYLTPKVYIVPAYPDDEAPRR